MSEPLDIDLQEAAVLVAIGFDGELIGMMTDDEVPRLTVVAWLRRVADEFERDEYEAH